MSIRNAGQIIREARLKAGLTQEQLSEGICTLNSLSRIELGSLGVSPSTFHTLMAHAGVSAEVLPIFANRQDFDCFYSLKRAHFFWDYWQLDATYDELNKIENMHWANNKYYYQEWLLLHCKLQNRSGCGDHKLIYDTLLEAIHISRPKFNVNEIKINEMLLSITEIELFIALAHESFYNNDLSICNIICSQISTYLENSSFASYEKEALLQRLGINDTIFTFFGSNRESQLYLLQRKLSTSKLSEKEKNLEYIKKLKKLITTNDILYKQYALFMEASYITDKNLKISQLNIALSITLPEFDINKILDYRLSWLELTILTNLSAAYCDNTSVSQGIQYFYKILEYLNVNNIDILSSKRIMSITITMLFRRLYRTKRFSEMLELQSSLQSSASVHHDIYSLANIYTHYCQALGECGQFEDMALYAHYSLSCYKLYNNSKIMNLLQKSILEDFNIYID